MPGAHDSTVRVMLADGFHWISVAARPPAQPARPAADRAGRLLTRADEPAELDGVWPLHLNPQLAGWMAVLGAALEIPVMIVAGRFAERFGPLRLVIASSAGATVFFCLLPLARSAGPLLAPSPAR